MAPDQIVSALNHTLRRRVLRCLHDGGEARSPRELAAALDCDLSRIGYHLAVLEKVNAVAVTDTIGARGSTERFYASTVGGDGGLCLVLIATERRDESR